MDSDTKAQLRTAGRVGAYAELIAIELRSLRWDQVPSPEPLLSPIALAADASIEVNGASTGTSLNYMVGATVTGTLTSGHQLFQLGAAYLVAFVTPPDLQPTPEEVTAFGNVSVVSIVYPYLRQLVADMTGRSGLPALTIAAHRTPFVNDLLETESVEA